MVYIIRIFITVLKFKKCRLFVKQNTSISYNTQHYFKNVDNEIGLLI